MIISLIVAADEQNGIGKNNALLCHLPADLKYFKQTTSGHHIVMGRKTFESVGRPLPKRVNVIITRNPDLKIEGCEVVGSIEAAIALAKRNHETELFITGGGNIYHQSIALANRVYITRIHHQFEADTFFPELPSDEWELMGNERHEADEKNAYSFSYMVYQRK